MPSELLDLSTYLAALLIVLFFAGALIARLRFRAADRRLSEMAAHRSIVSDRWPASQKKEVEEALSKIPVRHLLEDEALLRVVKLTAAQESNKRPAPQTSEVTEGQRPSRPLENASPETIPAEDLYCQGALNPPVDTAPVMKLKASLKGERYRRRLDGASA